MPPCSAFVRVYAQRQELREECVEEGVFTLPRGGDSVGAEKWTMVCDPWRYVNSLAGRRCLAWLSPALE